MKRLFVVLIFALISLAACGSAASPQAQAETAARQIMEADGLASAQITQIVAGDAAGRGADELYCVATDATTQNGELPYLVVVWRQGDTWQGQQLAEGYYDWDLQGCPR
jgi:hypothetical protein